MPIDELCVHEPGQALTRPDARGGFVLVGVVMFVLALTILGMSLFAISGYEATFLGESRDETAALYQAEGGVDMVCQILAQAGDSLASAHLAEGYAGVLHAVAYQTNSLNETDSTHAIDFGSPVTVVVTALDGDQTRTVSGRFIPKPAVDYYKRLFTVSGTQVSLSPSTGTLLIPVSIYIETQGISEPVNSRLHTVRPAPSDEVWQASTTDSTWIQRTAWSKTRPLLLGSVPVPNTADLYARQIASGTPYAPQQIDSTLIFNQHAGAVGYYVTPANSDSNYSFAYSAGGTLELNVKGTVVWMLPRGFRSDNQVNVQAYDSSPTTLVMVGSPNPLRTGAGNDPRIGLWFFGGINVAPGVSIILVSDGQVNIEGNNSGNASVAAANMSVFSEGLYLMGPKAPFFLDFSHPTSMDALIGNLESIGALPGATGAAPAAFTLIPGSWQDATP